MVQVVVNLLLAELGGQAHAALRSTDNWKYLLISSRLAIPGQAVAFKLTPHLNRRRCWRTRARSWLHAPDSLGRTSQVTLLSPAFSSTPAPQSHEKPAEPRD